MSQIVSQIVSDLQLQQIPATSDPLPGKTTNTMSTQGIGALQKNDRHVLHEIFPSVVQFVVP